MLDKVAEIASASTSSHPFSSVSESQVKNGQKSRDLTSLILLRLLLPTVLNMAPSLLTTVNLTFRASSTGYQDLPQLKKLTYLSE